MSKFIHYFPLYHISSLEKESIMNLSSSFVCEASRAGYRCLGCLWPLLFFFRHPDFSWPVLFKTPSSLPWQAHRVDASLTVDPGNWLVDPAYPWRAIRPWLHLWASFCIHPNPYAVQNFSGSKLWAKVTSLKDFSYRWICSLEYDESLKDKL